MKSPSVATRVTNRAFKVRVKKATWSNAERRRMTPASILWLFAEKSG
jgi:hypothetical protein